MILNRRPRRSGTTWSMGLAGLALGGGLAHGQDPNWTKRFRLGVVTGLNLEAEFSQSGAFGVSGVNPGPAGVPGQEHLYDDGYVRIDDSGNAGGVTSFWGYENASQYDAATETFTFHGTTSFDQSTTDATVSDEPYLGLDLAYGGRIMEVDDGVLGWELGFTFMPVTFEERGSYPVSAQRVTHRFQAPGIVPPQPPYNGSASGAGVVIQDVATEVASETTTGLLTGTRKVEADFMNFRLGPNLQWHVGGRWAASLAGGFAMGWLTGKYSFDERIEFGSDSPANNSGSFQGDELVFGGYAEAMVYFRAHEQAELFLGAQYVALGDATFSRDGREARLKLGGGIFISAGLHWLF